MKARQIWVLGIVLSLFLLACSTDSDTTLSFDNQTQCGTATIKITNTDSGTIQDYTLEEGSTLKTKVEHGVVYRYEITYAGDPNNDIACDPKSGTVMVPERGQSANFTLQSATPTPES